MRIELIRPYFLIALPALAVMAVFIDKKYRRSSCAFKARLTLGLRLAMIALLVVALCGPSLIMRSGETVEWALIDASDSARGSREAMVSDLNGAMASAPDNAKVGVIAFGADAMVEISPSSDAGISGLTTAVDGGGSDVGAALNLAAALLPEGADGRVTVMSDGRAEDADSLAALLGARGIAVDVLKYAGGEVNDAQISRVSTPSLAYQGQSFAIKVTMYSNYATSGQLVLYANRQPISTRDVTLKKGENAYEFTGLAGEAGVVTYEARLFAEGDERIQNDRMGAYMRVVGPARVLLVEGKAGDARELQKMLTATGMAAETVSPASIPESAESLRQYDAVALANVSADQLSGGAMEALETFVKQLGHGLAVFGGDSSYALGGYRGSKLEELLPVTIDVNNELELPSLALMLVIDKSGSMQDGKPGFTRIDMAKEAAARSVDVLTNRDQVGVIGFDSVAKWVVKLGPVEDVEAIKNAIGTIRADGGTAFYSPLYEALTALDGAEAQLKHIIFLTDGESGDSGYEQLAPIMAMRGITLTTVAVGGGTNSAILSKMASDGGGRHYAATEYDDIPSIFTKETYLAAAEAYVQNRAFTPVITEDAQLTRFSGFPKLNGYLTALEKPLATVSLVSDKDDPILAWWQYGAGRVLAWTSDTNGAWTGDFLGWSEAASFFSGLISHVLDSEAQEGSLEAAVDGGRLKLSYTAPSGESGGEKLETEARVLAPDGSEATVELYEVAPGQYEGYADMAEDGAYAVRVEQKAGGEVVRALEGGAVAAYSGEYDISAAAGADSLEKLAAATGGRVLNDASELFSAREATARARRDITGALLAIAACLFVTDVAQRRLPWEKRLDAIKASAPREKPRKEPQPKPLKQVVVKAPEAPAAPRESSGDALMAAKKRKKLM